MEVYAGAKAAALTGEWLPAETSGPYPSSASASSAGDRGRRWGRVPSRRPEAEA